MRNHPLKVPGSFVSRQLGTRRLTRRLVSPSHPNVFGLRTLRANIRATSGAAIEPLGRGYASATQTDNANPCTCAMEPPCRIDGVALCLDQLHRATTSVVNRRYRVLTVWPSGDSWSFGTDASLLPAYRDRQPSLRRGYCGPAD